jgi:hypothetical protein
MVGSGESQTGDEDSGGVVAQYAYRSYYFDADNSQINVMCIFESRGVVCENKNQRS